MLPELPGRTELPGPRLIPAALVALLVALVIGNDLAWVAASEVRFRYDFPVHATTALQEFRSQDLLEFLRLSRYGPVGYLPAGAVFSVWGPSFDGLFMSQVLWLPVYAASLAFLGRRLYGPWAGLLACLYLFTLPLFASITKEYPLEVGSHALSLAAAALLVGSDGLRKPWPSLLFGVALAAGAMTKPEFVALWIMPLGFLILRFGAEGLGRRLLLLAALCAAGALYLPAAPHLKILAESRHFPSLAAACGVVLGLLTLLAARSPEGRRRANLLLACGALAAVLLPYVCARDLAAMYDERMHTAVEGLTHGKRWLDPLWYLRAMVTHSFHGLHAGLLLAGLGAFFVRGDYRDPGRLFVVAMLAWTFALINTASGKHEIYLANLVGFAALAATGWLSGRAVPVVGGLLALWGVGTVAGWLLPRGPLLAYGDSPVRDLAFHPGPLLLADRPETARPPYREILEAVGAQAGGPLGLVVPYHENDVVHTDWFRLYAAYRDPAIVVPVDALDLHPRLPAGHPCGDGCGRFVLRHYAMFVVLGPAAPRQDATAAEEHYRQRFAPAVPLEARKAGRHPVGGGGEVAIWRIVPR